MIIITELSMCDIDHKPKSSSLITHLAAGIFTYLSIGSFITIIGIIYPGFSQCLVRRDIGHVYCPIPPTNAIIITNLFHAKRILCRLVKIYSATVWR